MSCRDKIPIKWDRNNRFQHMYWMGKFLKQIMEYHLTGTDKHKSERLMMIMDDIFVNFNFIIKVLITI